MAFSTVREEGAARLQEVNMLLGEIRNIESRPGLERDASLQLKKGLFFVSLYASFEYTVTRAIGETASQIHSTNVKTAHLHHKMYPLALDPQITSIASLGKDTKWKRRSTLFESQKLLDNAVIYESSLTKELGNIWCNTFKQIFQAFGIDQNHIYDPSANGYIDEVVNNRNMVAHGRSSATDVGQAYTSGMLEQRLSAVENQKEYLISIFEKFIEDREFVSPENISTYR